MNTPVGSQKIRGSLIRAATTVLFFLTLPATTLAGDIGILRIHNQSATTQSFVVAAKDYYCVDLPLPTTKDPKDTTIAVGPKSTYDMEYARRSGHNCDGKDGQFTIFVLTGEPAECSQSQTVKISGGAGLWAVGNDKCPTAFPSNVSYGGVDPIKNRNLYHWWVEPPVPPSYAEGYWKPACGGNQNCDITIESSLTIDNSSSTTDTKSLSIGFSTTVEQGFKFRGQGGKGSFTMSSEFTTSEAKTIARSKTAGIKETCGTKTDMKKYKISEVWQWMIRANVGGTMMEVATCTTTCTPDGRSPDYLPGDPEWEIACWKPRDPNAPQPTPTTHVRADRSATPPPGATAGCVDFFTASDGRGMSLRLCSDGHGWSEIINLGNPEPKNDTSFHGSAVQSFRCHENIKGVRFLHPLFGHTDASCEDGAVVNTLFASMQELPLLLATGVRLYRKL